jgi:glucose/arabinose dehydrogenase
MNEYVPHGMLQKEYHFELVNLHLYYHLYQQNTYSNLNPKLTELYQMQLAQLTFIKNFAISQGVFKNPSKLDIQYQTFKYTVEELYAREYQLLQEYLSYPSYFLPSTVTDKGIRHLIESQTEQVDTLLQLKNALMKDKKEQYGESKPNVRLQKGYRLEKVVSDLTYPTTITFDDQGAIYIVEAGYAYGTEPGEGRILKLQPNGTMSTFAGGFKGPITGITWVKSILYVAEGAIAGYPGEGCGRINRVFQNGRKEVIVEGLKTCGDHFTGDIIMGPDEKLFFTVGTATNSSVVGTDNLPWLKMHPTYHDTPSRNYVLNGKNFLTSNPLTDEDDLAVTGAFKPFGHPSFNGERLRGELKANGVLYCCNPDGSDLQIVADGFRNPFGLKFSPFSGKLFLTDNGADPRGSRQIHGDWDNLWEVTPNGWYGWPDFYSGLPVTLEHFHVKEQPKPTFLLKQHPYITSQPLVRFKPHTASHKFDFSTNPSFGYVGEIFVAQLGGMGFEEYEEPPGYKVVRVNHNTGQIRDFLVNPKGEANTKGPIRPVDAKFSTDGEHLYVVDFGILGGHEKGHKPQPKTGALWRIVKD